MEKMLNINYEKFVNEMCDFDYRWIDRGLIVLQEITALKNNAGKILAQMVKNVNIKKSIKDTFEAMDYESISLMYVLELVKGLAKVKKDTKMFNLFNCLEINITISIIKVRYDSEIVAKYLGLCSDDETDVDYDELCDDLHDELKVLIVSYINEQLMDIWDCDGIVWDIIPLAIESYQDTIL